MPSPTLYALANGSRILLERKGEKLTFPFEFYGKAETHRELADFLIKILACASANNIDIEKTLIERIREREKHG